MTQTDNVLNERIAQVAKIVDDQISTAQRLANNLSESSRAIVSTHTNEAIDRFSRNQQTLVAIDPLTLGKDWVEYAADAVERGVLYLDILRQRGNNYLAHEAAGMPPVLDFEYETIVDGRSLARPVNYSLLRILPPPGVTVDDTKRPFVVIDPRAGHGAGIGGMKPVSQVGVALHAGHPCYFVVFRPKPEPGQTIADVCEAEGLFLNEIAERHPKAPRPVVIGNCQGGWASMLLASSNPEKTGAVAISGAPLSYWAGKEGGSPMRYSGGLGGGVVPALISSDLGNGVFDGSSLVTNFENMSPGNTWWKKYYNLYAKADTEGPRFLEFERWWSGFFFMNEAEIRWIVEDLFIGNKLGTGVSKLGHKNIDLRDIACPVIVFASVGDNITPPQQALNWIVDLYGSTENIKARGQRIIYIVHKTIGHLGIFVSAKVAGREHGAITDTIEAIEALSPGLYELVLEDGEDRLHISLEPRTIDDIKALDDGRSEDAAFAAVARYSELGAQFYELTMRPIIRSLVTPQSADQYFKSAWPRVQRVSVSDQNPLVAPIAGMAEQVRENRHAVKPNNPFFALQNVWADAIENTLDTWRDIGDALKEFAFISIYDTPWMQAVGNEELRRRATQSDNPEEDLRARAEVQAILGRVAEGGFAEGVVRILIFLAKARGGAVRRTRLARSAQVLTQTAPFDTLSEPARARLIHEQSVIVELEPGEALATLPDLIKDPNERQRAIEVAVSIAGPTREEIDPSALVKLQEIEATFAAAPHTRPVAIAAAE
ncbi:pimeloyl-ACP methyl ester carboxylesterase/tellurite resistance protein [Pseudochelatococcus lubricantis]|uniref:Pimeloyl-ACP methyl ester carboxylesterase/tellurite resistance protein n=1 Tax=Pseudochelatococcus lubricantis TaxID=1538102 RepID=A0ABX0V2U5_9HYPH|nr:DUF3141 domain-containing protein [Pseudochelatococcus lubricantis]NIJ59468.1 pimeloyl-ACP methyl ester carboxylesterase/tellurite resistance protein [Pseudochelatococcus lubricantis]